MEKLQKALEKARTLRAQEAAAPAAHARQAASTPSVSLAPASQQRDAAWAVLRAIDPDTHTLTANRIVTLEAESTGTHFDILRTKVQLLMKKNGWTRLAITSPTSACGKTTIACNLAIGFNRQRDVRAMLVELDLRRPSVANLLGFRPERDVTSMLAGEVSFAEQAVRVRDNVAISAARRPSADPTAVLLSRTTHNTLALIEATYAPDIVIFDLPPLLLSDDTRAFLKEVDCALLVARAETSTVAELDVCEREIAEHTNMLGVVLNQCRHFGDGLGYEAYDYGT